MPPSVTPPFAQNPSFGSRDYGGAGNTGGSSELGERGPNALLSVAFVQSPILNGTYTVPLAKAVYEMVNADAESTNLHGFDQYRRNFLPVDSSGAPDSVYANPRDKTQVPIGSGGKPATPWTPNVASPSLPSDPGVIRPSSVTAVVSGLSNEKLSLETAARGTDGAAHLLNPAVGHNVGDGSVGTDNVGRVRRFRLGVGSSVFPARI